MKLTKRDLEIIQYLKDFKIATTDTVYELFFKPVSLQACQRRLLKLYNHKHLKRDRECVSYQYMYYINKPKQLKHDLILTELHSQLNKKVEIVDFRKEFSIENIRSDGFIAYRDRETNNNYISFIEVHICNTNPDIDKYIDLYTSQQWKQYFPTFPQLIVVSNRKIKDSSHFKIFHIKEDLSNIDIALQIQF